MNETTARALLRERSANLCEVRIEGVCLGPAHNYQHRKNRSQCGKLEIWRPSNALAVCGSGTQGCHGWIHAHPARSFELGWSVRQAHNPAERPAFMHTVSAGHGSFLLADDGTLRIVALMPA